MTFVDTAMASRPVALYPLDDEAPFQDVSGFNRTGTASGGTPMNHLSLSKGALYSKVFSNAVQGVFEAPVYNKGKESEEFTLEATVRVIEPDVDDQSILGNQNQMDGLVVNGTEVSFSTKYQNTGHAKASFDIGTQEKVHLVGVHTKQRNSLYVNGELVSEVDITPEQQSDVFIDTNNNLYTGATASSQQIAVNNVGIYSRALSAEEVRRHYQESVVSSDVGDVSTLHNGEFVSLSSDRFGAFTSQHWITNEDWNQGDFSGVYVQDNALLPQLNGELTSGGYWIDGFYLDVVGNESMYGAVVSWNGKGAVVYTSLDGENWDEVENGSMTPTITPGLNPQGQVLQVRVEFPEGINGEDVYIENLKVDGLISDTSDIERGRTITLDSSYPQETHHPFILHDDWGVRIETGGTIQISDNLEDEDEEVLTAEFWIKPFDSSVGIEVSGTRYRNGQLDSSLPVGQWSMLHIVSDSAIPEIVVSGKCQVGAISLYRTALAANEVAEIYRDYTGNNNTVVDDNSSVSIQSGDTPVQIYAHDWSIHASG